MAKIATRQTAEDHSAITFKFTDGPTVTVEPAKFSAEIQKRLMLHGAAQKLGDSYAEAEGDPKVGYELFAATLKNLTEDKWSERVGGTGPKIGGLLITALARVTGKTEEECTAVIEALDKDERAKLRKHPQLAPVVAQIEAERATARAAKVAKEAAGTEAPDISTLFTKAA